MIITDTHTHLYSESFEVDQEQMISRALQAGVSRFFVPAIDSTYSEAMYALERKYPKLVFLMTGVHPTHVKEDYDFTTLSENGNRLIQTVELYAAGKIKKILLSGGNGRLLVRCYR